MRQRESSLKEWANRAQVDLIGGQAGADPASIVYDAVAAAKARNADVLLCDTAGRLHNKKNLMEELRTRSTGSLTENIRRHIWKRWSFWMQPQDRMPWHRQRNSHEVANDITGIILTKTGRNSKRWNCSGDPGGAGIFRSNISVSARPIDDLQKFDADAFVNALFDVDEKDLEYRRINKLFTETERGGAKDA